MPVLSPEAVIALVTLVVTCPPSVAAIWGVVRRQRQRRNKRAERHQLGQRPSQDVVDQVNLEIPRPEQAHSATPPATDIELDQPNHDDVDDVALLVPRPAQAHSGTRS